MEDKEKKYSCDKCGTLRTKDEGGTVFTVCDDCWDEEDKVEDKEHLEEIIDIWRNNWASPYSNIAFSDLAQAILKEYVRRESVEKPKEGKNEDV